MTAKRQRISHVPGFAEVIDEPSPDSSLDRITPRNATEPVTLEILAGDLEDIKIQIAIFVEWLQTLDERAADDG